MDVTPESRQLLTRRRLLIGAGAAAAGTVAGAAGLYELVDNSVLPGKGLLNQIEGACDAAPGPPETYATPGPTFRGTFHSHKRNTEVGYTLAYPPGHKPGSRIPLVFHLHAHYGNHTTTFAGLPLAKALASRTHPDRPLAPFAMVAADGGGNLYWNRHPGDDPMAMLVDELLPRMQKLGLGRDRVGASGDSMGGYGAILLAEKHPHLIKVVTASGPAIFTSYADANHVAPGSYASPAAFAEANAVTHAPALAGIPARIASGNGDPFHPGVQALAKNLPPSVQLIFAKGCHDGRFFASQRQAQLAFLATHLS
ncbi:MAG: hypothetical protein J2O48_06845 [Solirubrobacterales bacterium]|nr:hypothetical protein [Solirubrobacterales bacterium]